MKTIVSRNGRLWCLKHKRHWKDCDCPGEVNKVFTISRADIIACTPQENAFMDILTERREL